MIESFLGGALAGFAIAVPVGAISILILETGLRRGFGAGFAAGSGAATADLIYATLAAFVGNVLALVLSPYATILRAASALFLIALGGWGLARMQLIRQRTGVIEPEPRPRNLAQTYLTLLALTILNPTTIAYFAALILGMNAVSRLTPIDRILFVVGAFCASWSWQTLLAAAGAFAHKHLAPNFRLVTSLIGNFMIIGLGLRLLV